MSEPKMKYNRTDKNWEDLLEDGDTIQGQDGNPCVTLRALQRLAQEAGIIESGPVLLQHVSTGDFGVFQCIYEVGGWIF